MTSLEENRTSSEDKKLPENGRETILQRRNRVLGTRSLRYVDSSANASTASLAGNKRRAQILQAQRAHRQRTLDYIAELESEIFRLRESEASLASTLKDKDDYLNDLARVEPRVETRITVNIHSLIQCLNGQVAPGLWITAASTLENEARVPPQPLSSIHISADNLVDIHLGLSSARNQHPSTSSLVQHDGLTRMLLLNFSKNIAPTLVAFDGLSNGYRSLLLPLAWENDLVRCALLASSANHLRFRRSKLTTLASSFQATAIHKLVGISNFENYEGSTTSAILAAIVLLIINGIMNGGDDFDILLNMAKSWIDTMGENGDLNGASETALNKFLIDQVTMIQLYAQPLLKEHATILAQYHFYSPDLSVGNFTIGSGMYGIFASLENAIKQACAIYSYHILNDGRPIDIEYLLETLKTTVETIPNYTPGENALAWVYFIAAAESSTIGKRTFFAKRLMGIYERGYFPDVTSAFTVLHEIWSSYGTGSSWTKVLTQIPLAMR